MRDRGTLCFNLECSDGLMGKVKIAPGVYKSAAHLIGRERRANTAVWHEGAYMYINVCYCYGEGEMYTPKFIEMYEAEPA